MSSEDPGNLSDQPHLEDSPSSQDSYIGLHGGRAGCTGLGHVR